MLTPTPTPEDLSEAQLLPWTTLRRFVDRFERLRADADRAEALASIDNQLDPWAELAVSAAVDARVDLTRAILATGPGFNPSVTSSAEKFRHPVRGVRFGSTVYMAIADPRKSEGELGRLGGDRIMWLLVFEADQVVDATDCEAFAAQIPGPIELDPPPQPPPAPPRPEPDPKLLELVGDLVRTVGDSEVKRRLLWPSPA